ncbi:MAG: AI-2E family transporter, partial [Pseudomonadota bacterium]
MNEELPLSERPTPRGTPSSPLSRMRGTERLLQVTLGLALVVGAFALLYAGRSILVPMALAVLLWFLIGALAQAILASPFGGRHFSSVGAKAVAVVVLLAGGIFTGKIIAEALPSITEGLDPANSALLGQLLALAPSVGLPADISFDWLTSVYPYDQLLSASVGFARDLVSDVSLVVLYVMFLLLDERFFDAKLRALVRDDARRADLTNTMQRVSREAQTYLRLMFFISAGVGFATFAICALFGVAGAPFWGFIAFILNFIP